MENDQASSSEKVENSIPPPLSVKQESSQSSASATSPLQSPGKVGIRDTVLNLEAEINRQSLVIEQQHKEIQRLHRMLDPLRLSLQSYTDQSESRVIRMQEKMTADQKDKNNQLNEELNALKSWKATVESSNQNFETQIKNVSDRLSSMNSELFGDAM